MNENCFWFNHRYSFRVLNRTSSSLVRQTVPYKVGAVQIDANNGKWARSYRRHRQISIVGGGGGNFHALFNSRKMARERARLEKFFSVGASKMGAKKHSLILKEALWEKLLLVQPCHWMGL
jgi:hypothetical protein